MSGAKVPISQYARQQRNHIPGSNTGKVIALGIVSLASVCALPYCLLVTVGLVLSDLEGRTGGDSIFAAVSVGILVVVLFISLIPGVMGLVFCGYILWNNNKRVTKQQQQIDQINTLDYGIATQIPEFDVYVPIHATDPSTRQIDAFRVGEVIRQFDQHTTSTITGWIDHDLSPHGWAVGGRVGGIGLGVGRFGISGESIVNLTQTGVTRDDPLGDGFIAILDNHASEGIVDTVRIVVPSDALTLQFVVDYLETELEAITSRC